MATCLRCAVPLGNETLVCGRCWRTLAYRKVRGRVWMTVIAVVTVAAIVVAMELLMRGQGR